MKTVMPMPPCERGAMRSKGEAWRGRARAGRRTLAAAFAVCFGGDARVGQSRDRASFAQTCASAAGATAGWACCRRSRRGARARAVECLGQRGELAFAGDGVPGGLVEGDVAGGGFECHAADLAVGQDDEADADDALLKQRGLDLFGDQRVPVALDVVVQAAHVGAEVDALGVGEDLAPACSGPRTAGRRGCRLRRGQRARRVMAFCMASLGAGVLGEVGRGGGGQRRPTAGRGLGRGGQRDWRRGDWRRGVVRLPAAEAAAAAGGCGVGGALARAAAPPGGGLPWSRVDLRRDARLGGAGGPM